jgi:hypothetical protein
MDKLYSFGKVYFFLGISMKIIWVMYSINKLIKYILFLENIVLLNTKKNDQNIITIKY